MDAKQVPLRELLASVPADARLVIDDADGKGTRFIPVGRLCQEAAAALAEPVQEPQRQPLSDEEIAVMRTSIPKTVPFLEALVLYTRAVERKHGIGGKDE